MITKNTIKILSLGIIFLASQVLAAPLSTNVLVTDLEPKVGQEVSGYQFLGGDDTNPKNWKKVQ